MARPIFLLSAFLLASLLAGCGGSTPPAEPVPAPTQIAAIDTPPPEYPMALACAGIGGQALLEVEVGTAGTPTRIDLVRGSGNDDLDRLAKESVQGWKFRPATRAGQPVAQTIQVPVNFTAPAVRPDACFALDAGRSPT
ncbi:energy transducer TonB [Pseudoxanthomonas daejeonensis]|uniref:Energy transducer TonB n=1 Tax=Pseudoxanthomonas daejeonensis TaxID=266062 RepID=A0ABQ6Z9W4_9GAMM|nr:energy transducer TonB [Pseudoxanthomonas daejeonensis]KAF1696451.1 energy transducer TonB [Pseudoxanthomonas daejeonensis]UNK57119.1 energy transducer TonB [Pseudoxanthomonas daejeonensis]